MSNQKLIITKIDKKIHSVEIADILFPFKEPIDINTFIEKYYESFSNILDIVDFTSFKEKDEKTEWTKEGLQSLIDNSNTIQKCVLEILVDKQIISKENLITEIATLFVKDYKKYGNLKKFTKGEQLSHNILKGHIAGLNRRINGLNKDKLFKIKKDTYDINKKYIELLKTLLKE